jgi:hypothetical protein
MRLIFSLFIVFLACNNPSSPQSDKPGASGPAFRFSKMAAPAHPEAAGNWCNAHFTDAILINADAANPQKRFFLLGEGIIRVASQLGNMTSSFVLRKTGERTAELYTSDNLPHCLSRREYFSLAEGGAFFTYDNQKGINYTVELQSTPEGLFVVLVFPPDLTYGLNVHRCTDCR